MRRGTWLGFLVGLIVGGSAVFAVLHPKTKPKGLPAAKSDTDGKKAIALVKRTKFLTTVKGDGLVKLFAGAMGQANTTCEELAHEKFSDDPKAKEYRWTATREKDGRFEVGFARKDRWGLYWLADLQTGRVVAKTPQDPEADRVMPNAPISVVDPLVLPVWSRKSGAEGIVIPFAAKLINNAKVPYVYARCEIKFALDFTNGERVVKETDGWTMSTRPEPTASRPWRPGHAVTCRATTRALERVYQSFGVKKARVWVEVRATDAFGKELDAAVAEIPVRPRWIELAWKKSGRRVGGGRQANADRLTEAERDQLRKAIRAKLKAASSRPSEGE